jgi:hypothetical protein
MGTIEYKNELITLKRVKWKSGYYVVGRNFKGHFKYKRKWHSKKDTEIAKKNIETKTKTYKQAEEPRREPVQKPEEKRFEPVYRYRITVLVKCKKVSRGGITSSFEFYFSLNSINRYITDRDRDNIMRYLMRSSVKYSDTITIKDIEIQRIYDLLHKKRVL